MTSRLVEHAASRSLGTYSRSRSAFAPELCRSIALFDERAQGRPGAGRARGPPAERNVGGSHHRSGRNTPALPCAMGLWLPQRSPRGPAVLPPSSTQRASVTTNLASAPGCQDHTAWRSAQPRSSAPRDKDTASPHTFELGRVTSQISTSAVSIPERTSSGMTAPNISSCGHAVIPALGEFSTAFTACVIVDARSCGTAG
jgi:hypothetical protein